MIHTDPDNRNGASESSALWQRILNAPGRQRAFTSPAETLENGMSLRSESMNESQQAFYDRISQYSFDEGDEELTFAARLAGENGWTPTYTARVIEEYKRFVFLAVVADHPVTPSDQVDQVWHLHLTYTHSYWDRFCGQVLGKPLHHGPTQGGSDEALKFHRWYHNTRESYARFFSHEPPTDIWPDASIRFGDDRARRPIAPKIDLSAGGRGRKSPNFRQ